ncbi:YueI family protein [Fructobacillus ficulneus]|uniref:Uncharacterized protein n=1 Tax=Fructobacillus ficulneus TaxID=157463 RepID=A0A0K8MFW0_9LACO|nr:YueI family protein [Fructobacillus ficulneus]GAO99395.1 hypothetical protein FFIC_092280 [Fructobacillus ficulneus]
MDDVNSRLEQSQQGNGGPKINPDEQRLYLGTFRERVVVAVKESQVYDQTVQSQVKAALSAWPETTLLIDQDLCGDSYTDYLTMAVTNNHAYTLLSNTEKTTQTTDPYAVVLAAKTAINQENINL